MVHVLSCDSSILGIETKGILGIETESEANLSYLRKPSQHPLPRRKRGVMRKREKRKQAAWRQIWNRSYSETQKKG